VKGVASAVEVIGKSTASQPVPGSALVGGVIGLLGHAARGIGETAVILGGVTEDITAETGKVFEDTIRQINPVDFMMNMLSVSSEGMSAGSNRPRSARSSRYTPKETSSRQRRSKSTATDTPTPELYAEEALGDTAAAENIAEAQSWWLENWILSPLRNWGLGLVRPINGISPLAPHLLITLLLQSFVNRWLRRSNGDGGSGRRLQRWTVRLLAFLYVLSVDQNQRSRLNIVSSIRGYSPSSPSASTSAEEPVQWFNEILQSLWFHRLDQIGNNMCHSDELCTLNGGIGPYVSASILHDIELVLRESDSMPDSIASVAVRELNFGTRAPTLNSVTVLPSAVQPPPPQTPGNRPSRPLPVRLRLSGAFLSDDFQFHLTLRMSSLKHAYLPSINIRVSQPALAFVVDATLVPTPSMPFVDHVKLTLAELPAMDLKVSPIGGVDLISIPGVRAWLQSELEAVMRPFVNPGYILLNVSSLYGVDTCDEGVSKVINDSGGASSVVIVPSEEATVVEDNNTKRREDLVDDVDDEFYDSRESMKHLQRILRERAQKLLWPADLNNGAGDERRSDKDDERDSAAAASQQIWNMVRAAQKERGVSPPSLHTAPRRAVGMGAVEEIGDMGGHTQTAAATAAAGTDSGTISDHRSSEEMSDDNVENYVPGDVLLEPPRGTENDHDVASEVARGLGAAAGRWFVGKIKTAMSKGVKLEAAES